MKLKNAILVNVLLTIFFVHGAFALVITSPNEGDTFKEGDIVKLVAELSPNAPEDRKIGYVTFVVTKGIDNCPFKISTHPRYECTFTIPPGSPQTIKISAMGKLQYGALSAPEVTIYITLPSNIILQQLKSFTGNRLFFSQIGENEQLYITGIYSDGVKRELWMAKTGTTYISSDEKIAVVDSNGLVTAIGVGSTKITIKNGDKQIIVDVVVKQKK